MRLPPGSLITSLLVAGALSAHELPPRNPFLADSHCGMSHCDSAQQNSVALPGPIGPSKTLSDHEIDYSFVGPIHYSSNTSTACENGRRVMWGHGVDRIVKLDHDSFEVVSEYFFPGVEPYTEQDEADSRARLNNHSDGILGVVNAFRDAAKIARLPGIYNVLDVDNRYYIGQMDGGIIAYGDELSGDCYSGIKRLGEFRLPANINGRLMGMNMTFDGWLIIATDNGAMIAVKRDFSEYRHIWLNHSENATAEVSSTNKGWIQNGFAIDSDNGIYIASRDYMHKVVWTGDKLSLDEADGAWSVPYLSDDLIGTGSTPSLMGFGDEDQLVVITDGQRQMHVTAFWRNDVPVDWSGISQAPSRRIAGLAAVTMGDPELKEIQSEQTVVIADYGAFVVNNTPRNFPWYLPEFPGHLLVSGMLGSNPLYQPFGVEKFQWNPQARELNSAWSRPDVSSPNSVPLVSLDSGLVYIISARGGKWTLEGLDWKSGENVFHYIIGDQRYNGMGAGIQIDEAGRINYGSQWGRVRLNPAASTADH